MDQYTKLSYQTAEKLTMQYSSSFGQSSLLFNKHVRKHIYAIYGLVRIADEIVDTYQGKKTATLLDALEQETYAAIQLRYSTNPIVHAFAHTAAKYGINKSIIAPFLKACVWI